MAKKNNSSTSRVIDVNTKFHPCKGGHCIGLYIFEDEQFCALCDMMMEKELVLTNGEDAVDEAYERNRK